MKNKKKIILFMQEKEKIIADYMEEDGLYFNELDEKIIESWTEQECTDIWNEILDNTTEGLSGLYTPLCPFCLFHIPCSECEYVKNHGGLIDSCSKDWNNITENDYIHTKFKNEVYLNIINKIEG
jgi:hypothetical protein